ncbi:MAG: CBS domain-containing protein [Nitrososphaeria archaeon]|jgi:CBS domain-containing protein
MSLESIIKKDIITVDKNKTISEIQDLFEKQRDLIVVSDGLFYEGIINESLAYKLNYDPATTKVKTLMKVAPKLSGNKNIEDVSRLMVESGFKTLPYVLQDGSLGGGVFADDVIAQSRSVFRNVAAKDIMTPDPVTLDIDSTIGQLLSTMRNAGVSRVIIMKDRKVAGIVTLHDIIQKVIKPKFRQKRDSPIGEMKDIAEGSVKSIMTEDVKTIDENTNAFEAFELMKKFRFSSVVVTKNGHLSGILTKEDLLKQIASIKVKEPAIFLQLSRKGVIEELEYDPETIRSRMVSLTRKYSKILQNSTLTVYVSGDQRQRKGKPHVIIRIQVNGPYVKTSVTGEGWGIRNSLVDAIHKLEKVLEKRQVSLTKGVSDIELQELLNSVLP